MSSVQSTSYLTALAQRSDWKSLGVSLVLVPILSIVVWWIAAYFASPLRKYPGPPVAGEESIPFLVVNDRANISQAGLTFGVYVLC